VISPLNHGSDKCKPCMAGKYSSLTGQSRDVCITW
jgi:hypothetical protein